MCWLLGFLFATAQALTFDEYLDRFGKEYDDADEYTVRQRLFQQRSAEIEAQNARGSWRAGYNDLTDATAEELQQRMGYRKELRSKGPELPRLKVARRSVDLPESVDWRLASPSVVTPIKSQGGCGSCWAFAATETIESHVAIHTGVLLSLSPQELTSCTPNPRQCGGSGGCTGATTQLAYDYVQSQGGLSDIWQYPYLSGTKFASLECQGYNGTVWWPPKASITGHVDLPKNDAQALMEAVTKGPVAVSVDASDWWMYSGGIFDSCNKTAPNINHAVVLDGYGTEDGVNYWLIRNSWGTMFGENGWIRLKRYDVEPCGWDPDPLMGTACKIGEPSTIYACGECGVLSDSTYPLGANLGKRGSTLDVDN